MNMSQVEWVVSHIHERAVSHVWVSMVPLCVHSDARLSLARARACACFVSFPLSPSRSLARSLSLTRSLARSLSLSRSFSLFPPPNPQPPPPTYTALQEGASQWACRRCLHHFHATYPLIILPPRARTRKKTGREREMHAHTHTHTSLFKGSHYACLDLIRLVHTFSRGVLSYECRHLYQMYTSLSKRDAYLFRRDVYSVKRAVQKRYIFFKTALSYEYRRLCQIYTSQ